MRLALMSDTHGLLRPEILPHLEDVDHIIHAGDVGPVDILNTLEAFAPVTAVWGNTDDFEVRARVPEIASVEWTGHTVVVLHGHQLGTPTSRGLVAHHPGADLIVFGHTHRPEIQRVGSVLVINPGSCGPLRFDLQPTLALADLRPDGIEVELVRLG